MTPTDSLALLMASAGIPTPAAEYRFAPPRRWRFDFAWPDYRIALEVEGGIWTGGRHVRGKGYEKDCEKYNTAQLEGWKVYRVTPAMIRDGRALELLCQALIMSGHPPGWVARETALDAANGFSAWDHP